MKKINKNLRSLIALLVIILVLVPFNLALAQDPKPMNTTRTNYKKQSSAPSNPSSGYTSIYIDNSGVVHVLQSDGTDSSMASGTVTSVALSLPNIFSVSGSPITSSGTLSATLASQSQNLVFGSPNGSSGSPSFRALVVNDLPSSIPYSKLSLTGTILNADLAGNITASKLESASNGQLLIGNGSGFTKATLTAGSNITITNSSGGIEIAATGGGGGLSFSGSPSTNDILKKTGTSTVGSASFTDSGTVVSFGATVNAQRFLLYESSNTKHGWGLATSEMRFFSPTGAKTTFGILSTGDGSTYTEKVSITATELNLTGSSQNLLFSGAGNITFSSSSSYIDFGTTASTQQIYYYHSGNTKAGVGLGSGVVRHFVGNDGTSIHSFGTVSTSDGSTYAQQYYIGQSANDHTGSGHNELFSGGGGISFNGVAPLSNSRIDLKDTVKSQAILIYSDGSNNRHGFGVAANQTRIFSPTSSYTSIGNISTGDGSTWTEYFRFAENGAQTTTQGTITSNTPFINHTATLNSGGTTFTLFKSNITDTASASGTLLMDLQVASTTQFNVRKDGKGYFAGDLGANITTPTVGVSGGAGTIIQSAGFLSSLRTGHVGFHMYNGGGVMEWLVRQKAGGTSNSFFITALNSGSEYDALEVAVSGLVVKVRSIVQAVVAAGNSSTSFTLDWNNGGVQQITLTGNVTSITLSNPVAGGRYIIYFATGAGSFTVTGWPAAVKWQGGTAPTITTTASKTDKIVLDYDGTNYYGQFAQNY